MIIAHVCLRLATIKGHYKCAVLLYWGGLKTSQYLVWSQFASHRETYLLRIELIRLLIVACGMLVHSSSMAVWSCWIFTRNWNTLSYTPIQSIPNTLIEWNVRWVCWPCRNWNVFSFQKLCTDPCNMRPCIIMLQHEVMSWMNGTTIFVDLVTVSLCIQNAINKMHLCSLSITYACPYHKPTATMGHSIHNVDITKPLTHTTSAICPIQWKPWRGHLFKVSDAIECEHFPTQVGYDDKLQSGRDPDENNEHPDELTWDGFWQFMQKFFGYSNQLLQQLSGWLVSDDLGGEDAGCGGPRLVWLHMVCGCEAGWMYCQILWNTFGDGLW